MKPVMLKISLGGLLLAGFAMFCPVQAQPLPQGSYLGSCRHARVSHDTLVAKCRRRNGRYERTTLSDVGRCIGDISNHDGRLHCEYRHGRGHGPKWGRNGRRGGGRALPAGSYRRSCEDIRLEGNTLRAVCRRKGGRERRTSLPNVDRCVGDIGNQNGRLVCNYGR